MAAPDMIIGRSGDSLTGKVLDTKFVIRTAFGELSIAIKDITWIHFRGPAGQDQDEIWHRAGDRAIGRVLGTSVRFKVDDGQTLQIAYSAIHSVIIGRGIKGSGRRLVG